MSDWYRRKTWEKSEEQEFFAKLGRARKNGRPQYLKIQAIELIATKNPDLLEIAEQLLNLALKEYPEDKFNRAQSLCNLGEIYLLRKNFDRAMQYYKMALDFELEYPSVKTHAYLTYSELAVKNKQTELYEYVEGILTAELMGLVFPLQKYIAYSLLSIINNHKNNGVQAKEFAKLADINANEIHSGFLHHSQLGLVDIRDKELDKLVQQGL